MGPAFFVRMVLSPRTMRHEFERNGITRSRLFGDRYRDRRTQPFNRSVQIVANLQREPVASCRELHVDDVLAVTKVNPRGGLGNVGARRQAVGVNADVIVPQSGPGLGDRPLWHRRNRNTVRAEFESDRALYRRPILRLDEEDSWPARLAARDSQPGNHDNRYTTETAIDMHVHAMLLVWNTQP